MAFKGPILIIEQTFARRPAIKMSLCRRICSAVSKRDHQSVRYSLRNRPHITCANVESARREMLIMAADVGYQSSICLPYTHPLPVGLQFFKREIQHGTRAIYRVHCQYFSPSTFERSQIQCFGWY
jgi:hypothetical protein